MAIRSRFSALFLALALVVTIATSAAAAAPAQARKAPVQDLADAVRVAGPMRVQTAQRPRANSAGASGGGKSAGKRLPAAPPAAPAPAPTAPPAGLLFNGEHVSDFPLLQAAPGAITEAPNPAGGGNTIEMTVHDADVAPITPTENPRAQALSPDIIDPGEEFWLSTSFYVPADYPSVTGWLSLVSVYGPPFAGSAPWGIEISGNSLQWTRNATYRYDVPWKTPLVKGSWVSVLLHERFASDGWVEMWINGQQVSFFGRETRLAMQTMDSSNGGGANAAKIMQYREAGMFDTGSIFFGPLKLGTTRESVGG